MMFFLFILSAIVIVFVVVVAVIVGVWLLVFKELKKKPKYIYTQGVDTTPENTQSVPYIEQGDTKKEE